MRVDAIAIRIKEVEMIGVGIDVSKGKITYCGKDIRNVAQADLHERIGFASQKAIHARLSG